MIQSLSLLLALFGSAGAAALITAWWQTRKYRAEVLHDAFSAAIGTHSAFVQAVARSVGFLKIELAFGHIWEYQKQEMGASLQAAQQQFLELRSKLNVYVAVHPGAEGQHLVGAVTQAADNVRQHLGSIGGWVPCQASPNGVVTIIRAGTDLAQVVAALEGGLERTDDQIRAFVRLAGAQWRGLVVLRARWWLALLLVSIVAFILSYLVERYCR